MHSSSHPFIQSTKVGKPNSRLGAEEGDVGGGDQDGQHREHQDDEVEDAKGQEIPVDRHGVHVVVFRV